MKVARTMRPFHLCFGFLVMAFALSQCPASADSRQPDPEQASGSPNDKFRDDAVRIEAEGDVLSNKTKTAEEVRLAIAKYKASLAICRELGDRRSEAELLVRLGALSRRLGDLHSTFSYHSQARQIAEELGDRLRVANGVTDA